ncbi:MAG: hypothetical protein JWM21_3019 [Acidobacteria bacterium]|nr:hypothetical protein [Acidobacteriota bacterium]
MLSLDLVTLGKIRSLAGDLWFARGEAYLKQGRVKDLREHQGKLSAIVVGTQDYRVRLWLDGGQVAFSCSCPLGDEGRFCKHCVAVALDWVENGAEQAKSGGSKGQSSGDDLRSFLEQQEKQQLIDIVLLEASENRRFRDRLTVEAARSNSSGVDLKVFRQSISAALRTGGVDYYSMGSYARGVHQVIESVAELLNDGHSEAVVKLTEFALGKVAKAIGQVDDSDGYMGEILAELQELHHSACEQADEDPLALATRLFEWEFTSDWDIFSGAAATYAEVLGSAGLDQYRLLAEAEWAEVPALGPQSPTWLTSGPQHDEEGVSGYLKRSRITSIMETLAQQAGDCEALVAIKRRDLSRPYSYLQIAEIYRNSREHDKALEWAEQGVRLFSVADSRLSDFLADEYHRRGRHAEAMALVWAEFIQTPGLETYQKLQVNALQMSDNLQIVVTENEGTPKLSGATNAARRTNRRQTKVRRTSQENSEWLQWREKALAHLRAVIDKEKLAVKPAKSPWFRQREVDHSQLVEIFLWEKKYEEAWQEATAGGCADYLLLRLADATAKDDPERALPVYKELIAPTLGQTNNAAYDEAIKLLRKLRQVMTALDRRAEFDDYLVALRVEYKRKRNFIKLLDSIWK